MASEESAAVPVPLLDSRFSGRAEFVELVRQALAAAAAQGWREIILSDPDFEDWPLGERAVAQSLNDWSKNGRKLTMLARNYDAVLRQYALFLVWRRNWLHIVDCRSSPQVPADSFPSVLWSSGWVLERLNVQRCMGVAGPEVTRRTAVKERLNERILNSCPAFPATVLGL